MKLLTRHRAIAMFSLGLALLCACSTTQMPQQLEAPATIILVRHAEKAGDTGDVALTAEGAQRAQELARVLGEAGIDAIYTSQYIRNIETARPLAEKLHITPTVIAADDVDGLATRLRQTSPGSTALVVGHTDTLPMIAEKLGVRMKALEHTEYDRLSIVTFGDGYAEARVLRFGN